MECDPALEGDERWKVKGSGGLFLQGTEAVLHVLQQLGVIRLYFGLAVLHRVLKTQKYGLCE